MDRSICLSCGSESFHPFPTVFSRNILMSACISVNSSIELQGKLVFWLKYACFLYLSKFALQHKLSIKKTLRDNWWHALSRTRGMASSANFGFYVRNNSTPVRYILSLLHQKKKEVTLHCRQNKNTWHVKN